MVLGRAAWLAAAGVGVGLVLTLVASRALAGMLFEISVTDPATYAGVVVLLGTVALMAAAIPAIRATRIESSRVLRL